MLMAAKKAGQIAKLALILLISSVGAYSVFVPQFGPIAAAWTITIMTLMAAISGFFLIHKNWKVLPPVSTLVRAILFSLLFGLFSTLWISTGVWTIVEIIVLSGFILASFFLTGELSGAEKIQLRKFIIHSLNAIGCR